MRSQKQIESSRLNGAKSRGPLTQEGKRISSQNSFKTGLHSAALVTLREKQADFETLRDEYYQHHSPQTPEERDILDTLIGLAWQLRRYAQVETQTWNLEIKRAQLDFPDDLAEGNLCGAAFFGADQRFARLHRMQAATQRQFKDTLHELERLKAARPEPAQLIEETTTSSDLGFVPSTQLEQVEQALPPANADEAGPSPTADVPPIPAFTPVPHSLSDKIEVNPL